MNLTIFNACLIAGWVLITIGALLFGTAIGLVVSGAVLLGCTFYLAAKFGVYAKTPNPDQTAEA